MRDEDILTRFRTLPVILFICLALARATMASAQLAARSTADWIATLENPVRVASLHVDMVVPRLNIRPGDVIADLGAGAGTFSLPFAKAVGPTGKVYAVDIDQGLLDYVTRKARAEGLTNTLPVLGQYTDPALPSADVDLAFLHDVLHHIENRAAYIRNAAKYLKPGGRFVVIEPDGPRGPHAQTPALQVSFGELQQWMTSAGLSLVERVPDYEGKWFVIFGRK